MYVMGCSTENLCVFGEHITYIFSQGKYIYMYTEGCMGENLCITGMHVDYTCPWCGVRAPRPEVTISP